MFRFICPLLKKKAVPPAGPGVPFGVFCCEIRKNVPRLAPTTITMEASNATNSHVLLFLFGAVGGEVTGEAENGAIAGVVPC